jgi:hypothetical protein
MTEPTQTLALRFPLDLDSYARLGQWLALSETGEQSEKARGASAALRLFFARELGLPPMAASELSVIKGRLFVQAKLLRALAATHGYRVERVDSTDETCTAVLWNGDGQEVGRSTFTIEQARRANLVKDDARATWNTYPDRMLWARASKYVLDDYAPEVTTGIRTFDELAEIEDDDRPPPAPIGSGPQAGASTEPADATDPTP